MKHIKIFESMEDMGDYVDIDTASRMNKGPLVYCIQGDNGSAVGMISNDIDKKALVVHLSKNPNELSVETFELERDGSFVVLTGNGDWKFVDVGKTYTPEEGDTQFTILEDGQMLAGFAGAETYWMIDSLSNILPEL